MKLEVLLVGSLAVSSLVSTLGCAERLGSRPRRFDIDMVVTRSDVVFAVQRATLDTYEQLTCAHACQYVHDKRARRTSAIVALERCEHALDSAILLAPVRPGEDASADPIVGRVRCRGLAYR